MDLQRLVDIETYLYVVPISLVAFILIRLFYLPLNIVTEGYRSVIGLSPLLVAVTLVVSFGITLSAALLAALFSDGGVKYIGLAAVFRWILSILYSIPVLFDGSLVGIVLVQLPSFIITFLSFGISDYVYKTVLE
jgi:hypothetical protein